MSASPKNSARRTPTSRSPESPTSPDTNRFVDGLVDSKADEILGEMRARKQRKAGGVGASAASERSSGGQASKNRRRSVTEAGSQGASPPPPAFSNDVPVGKLVPVSVSGAQAVADGEQTQSKLPLSVGADDDAKTRETKQIGTESAKAMSLAGTAQRVTTLSPTQSPGVRFSKTAFPDRRSKGSSPSVHVPHPSAMRDGCKGTGSASSPRVAVRGSAARQPTSPSRSHSQEAPTGDDDEDQSERSSTHFSQLAEKYSPYKMPGRSGDEKDSSKNRNNSEERPKHARPQGSKKTLLSQRPPMRKPEVDPCSRGPLYPPSIGAVNNPKVLTMNDVLKEVEKTTDFKDKIRDPDEVREQKILELLGSDEHLLDASARFLGPLERAKDGGIHFYLVEFLPFDELGQWLPRLYGGLLPTQEEALLFAREESVPDKLELCKYTARGWISREILQQIQRVRAGSEKRGTLFATNSGKLVLKKELRRDFEKWGVGLVGDPQEVVDKWGARIVSDVIDMVWLGVPGLLGHGADLGDETMPQEKPGSSSPASNGLTVSRGPYIPGSGGRRREWFGAADDSFLYKPDWIPWDTGLGSGPI